MFELHREASRNLELKARLSSLDDARQIALQVATQYLGRQRQVDTYFHCREGRLKLREIDGSRAQLISYERPDKADAKASAYRVIPVRNPRSLCAALAAALGVRVVVDKQREVFLYHATRIHLDRVESLGAFLEFEAVIGLEADDAEASRQLEFLRSAFALSPDDLLEGSYSDLLLAHNGG